jgi:hypothetical protein
MHHGGRHVFMTESRWHSSATGGHRFLSPIDINDVLSVFVMIAAKTDQAQYLVCFGIICIAFNYILILIVKK